jgi:hypothetical protein
MAMATAQTPPGKFDLTKKTFFWRLCMFLKKRI